jgi:prevent-host-death family protein
MYMNIDSPLSFTDARRHLSEAIDTACSTHEPIYVTRHGQPVAAIIGASDLAHLMELAEEMADIRAAKDARDEMVATGQAPIPWDEVKADLGLS